MIIEHVFHCITHFSCQILSFIHTLVLQTNGLKVDAGWCGLYTWTRIFSRDFGSKYHNVYI